MSSFGKTWWGEQWLNSLNNIDYSNRLPRGATYARKGAVKKISIKGNRIAAKVQGTRVRPYNIDIIMPPFFDPELSNFIKELSRRPAIISKMLNRELDPAVLSLAEQFNLKVFPKQWSDLKMNCSCPDWAVPCKHLASVIYKVSAEIDNNPFLVFSLHNVDLLAELEKLGIVIKKENTEIPQLRKLYFQKDKMAGDYNPDDAYKKLSFSKLKPINEALASLLTPFPPFYTASKSDFREKYKGHLRRIVKNVQKVAKGKISLPAFFEEAYSGHSGLGYHSENTLVMDNSFKARVFINDQSYSVGDFLSSLSQIQGSKTLDYQPSTASLHTVLHFAVQLVANGAIIPQIVQIPGKSFTIRWLPAILSKDVKKLIDELETMLPPELFVWQEEKRKRKVSKDRALNLLSLFISEIVQLACFRADKDIFESLFFKSVCYPFNKPGEEELAGGIQSWLQKFYITQGDYKPMLLVEELENETFRVNIQIENSRESNSLPFSLKEVLISETFNHIRYEILQSIAQLSSFIKGLDEYINTSGEQEIVMDNIAFAPFLMELIPAIRLLDISVMLPKSLKDILTPKASVRLEANDTTQGFLKLNDLMSFEWQVAIGDTVMGEEEFRRLLRTSSGLIKFKSNYIYAEQQDIEKLYKHFHQSKGMSAFEMLRTALSGEYHGARVALSDEVKKLIEKLTNFKEIDLPQNLLAKLRPYQKRGYSWVYRNAQIGFGSVLADDMGLGKTLQVIATILKFKEEGLLNKKKALVVAPTGLLTNWQAEVKKFAPSLQTAIYHGAQRKLDCIDQSDILLTSYGIARSDADKLKKKKWQAVVIDEAQNIKNQRTAQTKAIKSIKADTFIAMSGTPVENRLSEFWSIMDYSNRGFLGSQKEFSETYANPIEQLNDKNTADKLKMVTSPFLMRRLKSDKSIISDLPEKIEIDSYASLNKEQASLYQSTLIEAMEVIEKAPTDDSKKLFVRQGLVLQMILALKQICNHPTQFLKNGNMDASLSGKTDLLFDKLDSITESSEKVLIFTQFAEMGKLLQYFIRERYHNEPLYYHGGCSIKERAEMVDRFQNNRADKIFILSIKAAGTGLNLTAASHVIHYDLWWNPAVEAQATDRAYRIGQKNNVMVHRFITSNTFEEKINEMINKKKALAEMTVATGENWIGNLSNKELHDIFSLGE